jgi:hypothetical protein
MKRYCGTPAGVAEKKMDPKFHSGRRGQFVKPQNLKSPTALPILIPSLREKVLLLACE